MIGLSVTELVGPRSQFDIPIQDTMAALGKVSVALSLQIRHRPIIPGLPDDVAKRCLALLPRIDFPLAAAVCKAWRSFIQSEEFLAIRKQGNKLEEWMFVLTSDAGRSQRRWEVWGASGKKLKVLPPMPGPVKTGFAVAVLESKFVVAGGYVGAVVDGGSENVSDDVYQYDSRLNRWSSLAKMNVARYNFACTEVNGLIYVVGGVGSNGEILSSVEVYHPGKNIWSLVESLRRPRWGCFACSFDGMLYVMGGRSSFTIGNSKLVDIYSPEKKSWCEMKNGCVMVTAHAMLGEKLICMEWKNQRKLAIFDSVDKSWHSVSVPVSGSSAVGFCFGILNNKLLLFSMSKFPGYKTLLYDPGAPVGSQWQQTSLFGPSGFCLCSVTITT
ncbi:F-box/kelch-repeat protein At1g67480-like [Zingiber officinale]|uniref:F-box domain-containing protein n=1 Tax=Zingiber officinale TaxID=94328 RepID=A0A8J5I0B5_ZINOF|nr:F-box/kelch-repeat protein At1g67480-like [Zingiber officinale]XP_042463715.1 F-box/kelch-repeat protein At1g67480-like [Zingiber officinale]KAG6525483.1 hypothetical protein ZIOFF_015439 [Zingiber officinale]